MPLKKKKEPRDDCSSRLKLCHARGQTNIDQHRLTYLAHKKGGPDSLGGLHELRKGTLYRVHNLGGSDIKLV